MGVGIECSGPTGPMRRRPDSVEAVRIKSRLRRKCGNEIFQIHPSLQVRPKASQPFYPTAQKPEQRSVTKHEDIRSCYRVGGATGWIWDSPPANTNSIWWSPRWFSSEWAGWNTECFFLVLAGFACRQCRFPCKRRGVLTQHPTARTLKVATHTFSSLVCWLKGELGLIHRSAKLITRCHFWLIPVARTVTSS